MKIRILIATSDGPAEIQSLVAEDPDVACAICLNGSTEALPITRGYHAFVRKPTGIIERFTGHGSYRMDVSSRISNGESWQLGVYLAHRLFEQGQLALGEENADQIWLVTGAISMRDEAVTPVSHITEKLDKAISALSKNNGGTLVKRFILPRKNVTEIKDHTVLIDDHNIKVHPVSQAEDALLELTSRRKPIGTEDQPKSNNFKMMLAIAALIVCGGIGFAYQNYQGESVQPTPTEIVAKPEAETETPTAEAPSEPDPPPVTDVVENAETINQEETKPTVSIITETASETTSPLDAIEESFYLLETSDGQSCAGYRYRNATLQAEAVDMAHISDLEDQNSYCAVRATLHNISDREQKFSYKFLTSPEEVAKKHSQMHDFRAITLTAGEIKEVDLFFSLYRGDAFSVQLEMKFQDEQRQKSLSLTRQINPTPEKKSSKYQ